MNKTADNATPDDQDVTVFVVDDDDGMRRGTEFLVRSAGYQVRSFDSARAFLDAYEPAMRGCLLLDVRMPGMSGLELQDHLREERIRIPIIIITAFANVPMAVRAMQTGAFDFIEKPFDGAALINRIRRAIAQDVSERQDQQRVREAHQRIERLTPREREVMELVVDGRLNKQIAGDLGISMKTVENHRARVMEKMEVVSLADLVRLAIAAGVQKAI